MRKSTCRIATLPAKVRTEVNLRLRDGWQYRTIVDWLFAQKAEQDVPDLDLKQGDLYALAWTRKTKTEFIARETCCNALCTWFRFQYPQWLRDEADRDESIRLVEHIEQLTTVAAGKRRPDSTAGSNLLIRSMLIEAISLIRRGDKNPTDIARLANAWARMNHASTATEKLRLQTQKATDLALRAMYEEIKGDPAAIAQFNKFHDIVKRRTKRSS
jgi:hypothetical protein